MIKKFSYILSLSLLFIFSCTKENLLSSDTSASQKDVFDIAEEEGLIGISITLLGLIAFFTPVPAIIIIPFGLAILATEFIWAKRLLKNFKEKTEELSETAKGVFKKKNI